MEKITFVLLLGNKQDIDYVKKVQFKSIIKFVNLSDIDSYIIITKNTYIDYIKQEYKEYIKLLKLKIINEDDIIQKYNVNNKILSNYSLQMFLKLAIYKYVYTSNYITLDSDIYLVNSFNKENIYYNNKIRYFKNRMNNHTDWWEKSCKALNYEYKNFDKDNGYGVTPSIMNVNIIKELDQYIISLNKNLYDIFFLGITEYTLYWLFVLNNGYDTSYINKTIMNYDISVWFKKDIYDNSYNFDKTKNILHHQFNNKDSFFNLFQSTTDIIYTDEFIKMIYKYLE